MKATKQIVTVSKLTGEAITAHVSKDLTVKKARGKAIDGLWADGVRAPMLVAPKKDEPRELYDSIGALVVAGFSVAARAMLAADVKALPEIDGDRAASNRDIKCKANRRYWMQQIGSKISDYREALEKRQKAINDAKAKAEAAEKGEAAPAPESSIDARLKKELTAWIVRLEKSPGTGFDLVAMMKALKAAASLIK